MSWSEQLYEQLKAVDVRLCVTLPDSWIKGLISLVAEDSSMIHVPVAREEDGIGICCGASAGRMRSAMIIQNVGVMNSSGAIATLSISYGIPFLIIISDRGRIGDWAFYDVEKGRNAEKILEQVGVQCFPLPSDFVRQNTVEDAYTLAEASQKPIALMITKETFGAES